MARYRKIDTRIWTDAKFNELSPLKPSGQALFLYLLTARESTMLPGLMSISEAGLAERLGWSMRAFRRAWREIEHQQIAEADWKRQLVWLPNAAKYNEPANPNVVKGWFKHYDELPECELREVALRNLYDFILSRSSEFRKAFEKAFAKALAKGLRKQEQEQKQKQSSPHSAAIDTSSGDAPTAEAVGDGDGFDLGEGGVEPVGRGETDTDPGVDIPTVEAASEAVELVEMELAQQTPEAHSEPPPIAEPDPIAETPQKPTEPATDTGPFSAVSGLIDNLRAGLDAMGDNRPPGEMNPNDVMTKGQVQNAMIRGGRMHIVSDVATQRGLIELTRMQPTAGELQRVMELYENVGPGYLAKVIGTERQGGSRKRQFSPPAQAQQPTAITVPRKVEAIHESHERCKRAHLAMQLECGLSPNEAEAERLATRGMPTDDDRERYLSANKDWNNLAERERSAMNACLASVYAH